MPDSLITPHGGSLVDLVVDDARTAEIKQASLDWPSIDLTPRQACDLELLINGGFSPLTGFLGRDDYDRVVSDMRLADGTLWPIPVTFDVSEETASSLIPGSMLALRDDEGVMLAVLHVSDIWEPDREPRRNWSTAPTAANTPASPPSSTDRAPGTSGGRIEALALPHHYDFVALRMTPAQVRQWFVQKGWRRIVAFQTRNPIHRAHLELTVRAAKAVDANLLIHPVVGMTKPGDVDHYTRVRAYQAIMPQYTADTAELALLPLAMRMAGPREAVWHAIIRKNHGCTHFIVGRDHAGPGTDSSGTPFYGPYEAQEPLAAHEKELGVAMVDFKNMVYLPDSDTYAPDDEVPPGTRTLSISGTELRERLQDGTKIPEWFTFPAVAAEPRKTHPRAASKVSPCS